MLMRFDPFRELDRLSQQAFGTALRPGAMPMDAYRTDGQFVVHFDLPGVDPSSIDLTVEKDVLTITAERSWQRSDDQDVLVSERPQGKFRRQLFLGESLDSDRIAATYKDGVLTITLPISDQARPRKIQINAGHDAKAIATSSPAAKAA